MHKAIQSPSFQVATVRFLPRVAPLPLSLTQGTTTPRHKKKGGPSTGSISAGEENSVAPYFCVQKDFAPSSSNCRRCRPGRPLTCRKVGNAPYSSVPQYTWVTSPRHPRERLASEVAQRTCLLSLRRQRLPRPSLARRAAPPADQTREGPKGPVGSHGSCPRQPAHLPLPGPARSPGPPAPEPAGGPGPSPGLEGGRGPESLRRRGRPEPWGSREGSASLPSPPGRLGPSAACASSGWRFDWAGPGPPPEAGRIRQGPRPGAGGGRVQAAGRAGRPAGGRRVAAAPGLK